MPLDPVLGRRCCSHCLKPPFPDMSKHLLKPADLLQPELLCSVCRSVPDVPRKALIPTSPFIAVWRAFCLAHTVGASQNVFSASPCHWPSLGGHFLHGRDLHKIVRAL